MRNVTFTICDSFIKLEDYRLDGTINYEVEDDFAGNTLSMEFEIEAAEYSHVIDVEVSTYEVAGHPVRMTRELVDKILDELDDDEKSEYKREIASYLGVQSDPLPRGVPRDFWSLPPELQLNIITNCFVHHDACKFLHDWIRNGWMGDRHEEFINEILDGGGYSESTTNIVRRLAEKHGVVKVVEKEVPANMTHEEMVFALRWAGYTVFEPGAKVDKVIGDTPMDTLLNALAQVVKEKLDANSR